MSIKANESPRTREELLEEVEQLRSVLSEAEQTLDAIRSGDVDALVVTGPNGDQIFSLTNVERMYRRIVETMSEAALTVDLKGVILFCNQSFCDLMKTRMQDTIGQQLTGFLLSAQHLPLRRLLADAQVGPLQKCFTLRATDGVKVPVQFSASLLLVDTLTSICLVATDLTELESQATSIQYMRVQQEELEQSQEELEANNTLLNDARRAALNITEDAIAARLEVEEAIANLHHEMRERLRAEKQLKTAHDQLDVKVSERTKELSSANEQLMLEIDERKMAEDALLSANAEISKLKDRLQAENVYLKQEVSRDSHFDELIGHSEAMSYVFFRVDQVAPQDATVLLLGETGTGKGLVAHAIHHRSARKDRSMITVNCTALPANLIESELFGREKGAFTGASARQMGRFELADGGTIFLDEIGEMPMELQVKLLRVIQDGEFERLGSPRTLKVNVRIIAASNRNLEEEILAGRFREDLYYRLSVFPITIPPLRQRSDDIELLMRHFVAKYSKKIGKQIDTVPKETLELFQNYHWPGNVRELENVIERAVITSQGPVLRVLDQFDNLHKPQPEQDVKALADLERDHIVQVLQKTTWRIEGEKGAALILGLNPSTLRARMRKYGIRRQ